MLTRKEFTAPERAPSWEKAYDELAKAIKDHFADLNRPGALEIFEATFDGAVGGNTPAAGAFTTVSASGQITSTVSTGTAPLVVASTTKVTNLNADTLDGNDSAYFLAAGSYTAADVLAKLLTVDGSGSGLDADTVDGVSVSASTYTPTLTNTTNVAASTAYACQYLRVGNVVTVSGKVDIDTTGAGNTVLGISLPVASSFSSDDQAAGVAALSGGASQESGAIYSDAANDRAGLVFYAVTTSNSGWYFTFTYRVI